MLLRTGADQKAYGRAEATIHVAAVLARAGLKDSARRTLSRIPDSLAVDPTHVLGYHKAFAWRMAGDMAEVRRQLARYLGAVPARRGEFANGGGWWFRGVVHQTRMVAVKPGVALEVLDWGGSGRPGLSGGGGEHREPTAGAGLVRGGGGAQVGYRVRAPYSQ